MSNPKSNIIKHSLHPRNRNRERYDLTALGRSNPKLSSFIIANRKGQDTVDFSEPVAVKELNRAILMHYYGIEQWDFPDENLCPPIPGRAEYIHHVSDLFGEINFGKVPKGGKISCLDIGVGASCIYPIIGVVEYAWNFIGTDIDATSLLHAQKIIDANPLIQNNVSLRLQKNPNKFFSHILDDEEKIDATICNPPFHASEEDAIASSNRKLKNLHGKEMESGKLNFSGVNSELIYKGGESRFIQNMIRESSKFSNRILWFTTLVSKQSNLKRIYAQLEKMPVQEIKTIAMGTGNKSSRIIAWTFYSRKRRIAWREEHWN